jgi:hypothetical protein
MELHRSCQRETMESARALIAFTSCKYSELAVANQCRRKVMGIMTQTSMGR